MDERETVRLVWEHLDPELAEQGYELVEVEYGPHGASTVLRLYIDKEGGMTIDDCADVSRLVSPLLDMKDYMSGSYNLEVSSPGFDRPIRKPEDFVRFAGERIKLRTVMPVQGRKRFTGILRGCSDGLISFDEDGKTYLIHLENVKKAFLDR